MKLIIVLSIAATLFLTSCASLTVVDRGGCGTGSASNTCLGKLVVPDNQVVLFNKSSQQVIDALSSSEFHNELSSFVTKHSKSGKHADAWNSFDLSTVQAKLIDEVNGLEIETYGGIYGGLLTLSGNIAFDGSEDGPIRLNRWALPRPTESIANTIAHEAAHRIGYSHPHSEIRGMLDVAYCEPPYVIGAIVEKVLLEDKFNNKGHCNLLAAPQ